jgi:hypothetical protein
LPISDSVFLHISHACPARTDIDSSCSGVSPYFLGLCRVVHIRLTHSLHCDALLTNTPSRSVVAKSESGFIVEHALHRFMSPSTKPRKHPHDRVLPLVSDHFTTAVVLPQSH